MMIIIIFLFFSYFELLFIFLYIIISRLTIATVEMRNVSCVLALPKLTSANSFGGRERERVVLLKLHEIFITYRVYVIASFSRGKEDPRTINR